MFHEHCNGDCVVPVQSEASLNVLLHLLTSVCDDHWVSGPCLIATSESHDVSSTLEITQLRRLGERTNRTSLQGCKMSSPRAYSKCDLQFFYPSINN